MVTFSEKRLWPRSRPGLRLNPQTMCADKWVQPTLQRIVHDLKTGLEVSRARFGHDPEVVNGAVLVAMAETEVEDACQKRFEENYHNARKQYSYEEIENHHDDDMLRAIYHQAVRIRTACDEAKNAIQTLADAHRMSRSSPSV